MTSFGDEGRRDSAVARPARGSMAPVPARAGSSAESLTCQRCGFPVVSRPWGCKNPCANCGTVYPLGDCSD